MSKRKEIEVLARGVCVKDGMLLLCHGKRKSNTYLPGGHIEFKESAATSLSREIKEEMGLRATVGRFLGCVEHTFKHKGKRTCEINFLFAMSIPGLKTTRQPPSCEDYIEFLWWPLDRLGKSALEPFVLREKLPAWIKGDGSGAGWASTLRGGG